MKKLPDRLTPIFTNDIMIRRKYRNEESYHEKITANLYDDMSCFLFGGLQFSLGQGKDRR